LSIQYRRYARIPDVKGVAERYAFPGFSVEYGL
jgi:hypothetical protein